MQSNAEDSGYEQDDDCGVNGSKHCRASLELLGKPSGTDGETGIRQEAFNVHGRMRWTSQYMSFVICRSISKLGGSHRAGIVC